MLDDSDYVKRIDSEDALGVIAAQPKQLEHSAQADLSGIEKSFDRVVVAGMGGSALSADVCRNWWSDSLEIPFGIVRDYKLPKYLNKKTLVICSSHSGNTEETVSIFNEATELGLQTIVISSGGKLAALAKEHNRPYLQLPHDYQPRMTAWFGVKVLADIFDQLGLTDSAVDELKKAGSLLYAAASDWKFEVPTSNNQAKRIAEDLMGKAVWIYGGPKLASAAYKWKIGFNENAKSVASCNVLPEFNHNEYLGWTSHPVEKPFGVVELISSLDHERVQRRFEVSNRLLSGRMPPPIVIEAKGQSQIEQIMWSCLLGDFVSVYSGILNGVNPTKVEAIEKLKKEL